MNTDLFGRVLSEKIYGTEGDDANETKHVGGMIYMEM